MGWEYGGYVLGGTPTAFDLDGDYWASTSESLNNAYYLGYRSIGYLAPSYSYYRYAGFTIRYSGWDNRSAEDMYQQY